MQRSMRGLVRKMAAAALGTAALGIALVAGEAAHAAEPDTSDLVQAFKKDVAKIGGKLLRQDRAAFEVHLAKFGPDFPDDASVAGMQGVMKLRSFKDHAPFRAAFTKAATALLDGARSRYRAYAERTLEELVRLESDRTRRQSAAGHARNVRNALTAMDTAWRERKLNVMLGKLVGVREKVERAQTWLNK